MIDRKLSVLLHGPVSPFTSRALRTISRALRDGVVEGLVLATYGGAALDSLDLPLGTRVVRVEDVDNPGFFNVNRQANVVSRGLEAIDDDQLVIKLRSDQTVNLRALRSLINERMKGKQLDKIFITDCFTRTDRRYHPSDMLMVGRCTDLRDYFDLPPVKSTHVDEELAIREDLRSGRIEDVRAIHVWPESRLFMNFLAKRGVAIIESDEASLASIFEFCELISASKVNLRWQKFYRGRLPLVPYEFKLAPFNGGPVEDARCIPTSRSRWKRAVKRGISRVLWSSRLAALRAPQGGQT